MTSAESAQAQSHRALWIALISGGAVSLAGGIYGSVHDSTGHQTIPLFFSNTLSFKAWATTGVLPFALFQLWSSLRMWGEGFVAASDAFVVG